MRPLIELTDLTDSLISLISWRRPCREVLYLYGNYVMVCNLPDVINCQFREFATAPLGPVHFLSPDQESVIHCLIICGIQLLSPNSLGKTRRRICLLNIRSVSALEVLHNRALQINIHLLSCLLCTTLSEYISWSRTN